MKLILFFTSLAVAQGTFVAKPAPQAGGSACEKKVEAEIRKVAQDLGAPKRYAIHLTAASSGRDMTDHPLTTYKSGVFIVDSGTLSNSSAEVLVRDSDSACQLVSVSVSVGP